MTNYAAPPINAALTDPGGQMSQAWRAFMRSLGSDASRVGDYIQTARTDLGSGWLLCDGSAVSQSDYPSLYALLKTITSPGASPGTFQLPGIAPVYNTGMSSGPTVMQTWIKAR